MRRGSGKILIVRTDADPRMGTGHFMRCLALTLAWREAGGAVTFRTACAIPRLLRQLVQAGVHIEAVTEEPGSLGDADLTRETADRLGADWVVLDGYHFNGEFQRRVRSQSVCVLAIDDFGHAEHYWADIILNQNLHAHPDTYSNREPHTRLLLGPSYAVLRSEFWRRRGWRREIPDVARKVLVTLGGSDSDNVTLKVVRALQQLDVPGLQVAIVVGAANPNYDALESAARQVGAKIELRTDVTDMSEMMVWADVSVAAGGTTTWERALLGLPTLVLVLADNQRLIAESSEQAGIAWNLRVAADVSEASLAVALERLLHDAARRADMARRGPQLVDGQGAQRVCRYLEDGRVQLRPIQADDCRRIWEWANDPTTRAVSFSSDPIPWEEHQRWFAAKLNDPRCAFFIALKGETPIGQVRFDCEGREALISVALDANFRGRGYSRAVIRRGTSEVFEKWPVERILAYIRTENEASYRAFLGAGFRPEQTTEARGHLAHLLTMRREEL